MVDNNGIKRGKAYFSELLHFEFYASIFLTFSTPPYMKPCVFGSLVIQRATHPLTFPWDEWVLLLVSVHLCWQHQLEEEVGGRWCCPASMSLLIRKDHSTGNDPVQWSGQEISNLSFHPPVPIKAGRLHWSSVYLRYRHLSGFIGLLPSDDDLDCCSPDDCCFTR